MKNQFKALRLGNFEVKVRFEDNKFVGLCYDSINCCGIVTSYNSFLDCALKGISYLKTLNDLPSNYDFLPDMNVTCLQ